MMNESKTPRPIRSYVRREGRMTKAQARVLSGSDDPFLISLNEEIHPEALFEQAGPLTLEIGFGMGESLLEMAIAEPDRNFIGVEVHRPGVGAFLLNCHKQALSNVRVCCDDVNRVLAKLPANVCDRIQIFFPDPWHKKRHHKRRLIQHDFLTTLAEKLTPQGVLHIATDWQAYAEVITDTLTRHPGFHASSNTIRDAVRATRPTTKYEKRGLGRGHQITEFVWSKAQ